MQGGCLLLMGRSIENDILAVRSIVFNGDGLSIACFDRLPLFFCDLG